MFRKRDSLLDESRGTLTQTVINQIEREENGSKTSSRRRDSIHSDWSELLPVSRKVEYRPTNDIVKATTSAKGSAEIKPCGPPAKKTIKNIELVPYTPKPKD